MAPALELVEASITAACERAGRRREEVRLIAVTKKVPPDRVREAAEAGVREFGENYVQELEAKREAASDAIWHFLGAVQRNKASRLGRLDAIVHGLEPGAAAERLAEAGVRAGEPVRALLQVDFAGHRVGVDPDELERFAAWAAGADGLEVLGLMAVPPLGEPARPYFARLRDLRDGLAPSLPGLRELSMGMSADYEEAIEEGATMVRVGTAIFGPRP